MSNSPERDEEMVTRIAQVQRALYAYVRALVGGWGSVDDVLQEVNLVLWRKANEFSGGEFLKWACHVAYLQVLAHAKKVRRERFVPFDDAMLEQLAAPLSEKVGELNPRLDALKDCLDRLPDHSRQMISGRYADGGSVDAVARSLGRQPDSVRVTLHRIRKALLDCVQRKLAGATS